jgi:hypothetical protein
VPDEVIPLVSRPGAAEGVTVLAGNGGRWVRVRAPMPPLVCGAACCVNSTPTPALPCSFLPCCLAPQLLAPRHLHTAPQPVRGRQHNHCSCVNNTPTPAVLQLLFFCPSAPGPAPPSHCPPACQRQATSTGRSCW